MTIGTASNAQQEIDYFQLHNRKKKHIDVEMLDYKYVEKSEDLDELKGILALLRSGKEGRYPDLELKTEERILTLLPIRERNRILLMKSGGSRQHAEAEKEKLSAWAAEMTAQNAELERREREEQELPPVRGTSSVAVSSDNDDSSIQSVNSKKPSAAIPGGDFRSWEKYNVEAALEEIDEEEERVKEQARRQRETIERRAEERKKELSSIPSHIRIDKMSQMEKNVYAQHEKNKGNECFKINENEEAVMHYTRSMAFDDTNAIVYANRGMAHLRLKNFALAEQDCSRAIHLDPLYSKSWTRRGMTRFYRGKYKEAVEDFEESLRLEPNNKEVENLMRTTRNKWSEVDGTAKQQFKRFEIIEEGEDEDEDDEDSDGGKGNQVEKKFQHAHIAGK